ncbi:HsmA family protein [Clostridium tagluense]|uniref:HsmA family protein n=1 Tax=Clostridium tagluense TaxID=360422 RepID=UPI001CF4C53C|nr:HsmA family protein [Clostridium tagluense]MCB2298373.1 TIGR03987 family protein [Clostridium tagluense]
MLVFSIILVSLALIIYTISILNEYRRKTLLPWHAIMFCIGFIFDVSGTFIMYKLGGNKLPTGLHGILGYIALLLMLINAIGAIFILNKKYKNLLAKFYKFSLFSWIVWMVSYILGMLMHM